MKNPGRKKPSGGGFTLIEVLVAVAILAMIFSIVFGTFFYTVNSAEEQEERATIYQKASFMLNNITQNVSSAYVPFGGLYEPEEDEQPIFLGTQADDPAEPVDKLSIFTTNPRFAAPSLAGEIACVSYAPAEVDALGQDPLSHDENNPCVLACTVTPLLTGTGTDTAAPDTLDTPSTPQWTMNIRSLKFEYFDGTEWVPEWTYEEQGMLPAALKVSLEMADSSGETYSFSTIACIHANTVLEELKKPNEEQGTNETEQQQKEQEQNQLQQNEQTSQDQMQQGGLVIAPDENKPDTFEELLKQKR